MTKQDLIDRKFKYMSTQNCINKTEVWAKFSGYEDVIHYCYYFPKEDTTSPIMITTYVSQLDMLAQMRDKLREDFLSLNIQYDKDCIWSDTK